MPDSPPAVRQKLLLTLATLVEREAESSRSWRRWTTASRRDGAHRRRRRGDRISSLLRRLGHQDRGHRGAAARRRRATPSTSPTPCASRSAWWARSSPGTSRCSWRRGRSAPRSRPAAPSCSSRPSRRRSRRCCSAELALEAGLPAGRAQRRHRRRRDGRRGAGRAPRHRQDLVHRLDRGRQADRAGRERQPEARLAGAGRQVAESCFAGRRPRRGGRTARRSAIFFNSGQVCTAGSRLFVARATVDEVVEKLAGARRR